MDSSWIVIVVFCGVIATAVWSMPALWSGKRHKYPSNPLPDHRQKGATNAGGAFEL